MLMTCCDERHLAGTAGDANTAVTAITCKFTTFNGEASWELMQKLTSSHYVTVATRKCMDHLKTSERQTMEVAVNRSRRDGSGRMASAEHYNKKLTTVTRPV